LRHPHAPHSPQVVITFPASPPGRDCGVVTHASTPEGAVSPGRRRPRPARGRPGHAAGAGPGAGWRGEAVAAQDVEVLELQRGQAGDILIADLVALGAQLGDRVVDVLRAVVGAGDAQRLDQGGAFAVAVAVQWQKASGGDWAAYAADVGNRTRKGPAL
jgi:hypothetical protein